MFLGKRGKWSLKRKEDQIKFKMHSTNNYYMFHYKKKNELITLNQKILDDIILSMCHPIIMPYMPMILGFRWYADLILFFCLSALFHSCVCVMNRYLWCSAHALFFVQHHMNAHNWQKFPSLRSFHSSFEIETITNK